jgi:hypothetical protein
MKYLLNLLLTSNIVITPRRLVSACHEYFIGMDQSEIMDCSKTQVE